MDNNNEVFIVRRLSQNEIPAALEQKKHICFFFVDGDYHRKGIGTGMCRYLLKDYSGKTITLNSSPYGVPFHKVVGFKPADEEKTAGGIRFTPVEYRVEGRS